MQHFSKCCCYSTAQWILPNPPKKSHNPLLWYQTRKLKFSEFALEFNPIPYHSKSVLIHISQFRNSIKNMCGVPEQVIHRICKLLQDFLWKCFTHHSIHIHSAYEVVHLAPMGVTSGQWSGLRNTRSQVIRWLLPICPNLGDRVICTGGRWHISRGIRQVGPDNVVI